MKSRKVAVREAKKVSRTIKRKKKKKVVKTEVGVERSSWITLIGEEIGGVITYHPMSYFNVRIVIRLKADNKPIVIEANNKNEVLVMKLDSQPDKSVIFMSLFDDLKMFPPPEEIKGLIFHTDFASHKFSFT